MFVLVINKDIKNIKGIVLCIIYIYYIEKKYLDKDLIESKLKAAQTSR